MTTGHDEWRGGTAASAASPPDVENVQAIAARLGITVEKVLRHLAAMAFADLRRIVDWDEKGMKFKPPDQFPDDDMMAVAEVVASATSGRPYRIGVFDEKRHSVLLSFTALCR